MNLTIGASVIPAILGVDPWKTAQQLYDERVSGKPFEGNEHTRRGNHLEPGLCAWYLDVAQARDVVADVAERLNTTFDSKRQVRIQHPNGWAHATPDLVVDVVPINGSWLGKTWLVVDVKCPSSSSRRVAGRGWVKVWDEGEQLAPLNYRAQVLWQIHVARAAGIPVAGGELAAGPLFGKLHRIFVAPDAEWFELAMARATEFRECLRLGRPLPPHFTNTTTETAEP